MMQKRGLTPPRPPSLREGDKVRLKFLYPNHELEIIDCTWIAIASLDGGARESQTQWVIFEFEGRKIWKPLGCLIQAEVLEGIPESPARTPNASLETHETFQYHR